MNKFKAFPCIFTAVLLFLCLSCSRKFNNPVSSNNNSPNNTPPLAPNNPSPADGALYQSLSLTLRWSCLDPDVGDTLTFDVFWGKNTPPPIYSTNQSSDSIFISGLEQKTNYYWQIRAKDQKGATTTGPIWKYTTRGPWALLVDMPSYRTDFTASELNKIYVIGGIDQNNYCLSLNEMFDPLTNNWRLLTSMATPRYRLASGVVNGKIYAIGGWSGGVLSVVEEYSISTNTWTTKAPMPTGRYHHSIGVVNNKIYAIGGSNGYGVFNTVEEYDPSTNTWQTKAPMPSSRSGLATAVFNNIIYAIGGQPAWTTVEAFDPISNTWTTKTSMPTGRYLLTTACVNSKIYAIGGSDSSTVEMYDPLSDTWSRKESSPSGVGNTSCVVNGKVYVFGNNKVYEYDPLLDP